MRKTTSCIGMNFRAFTLAACVFASSLWAQAPRDVRSLDPAWKFNQADAIGAEAPAYDDASWKTVDVPHDWAIAGPFDPKNPSGGAGAFAPAGVGWYRKHFTLAPADAMKRVFVEFDGVMANSDVWINGTLLGHRPNGYVSFRYELTGKLRSGADNVLAVRADNARQPSSRWYEGAGIYRHVRLLLEEPVHVAEWGTSVSTPAVSAATATVKIQSAIVNQSGAAAKVSIKVTLMNPAGRVIGTGTSAVSVVQPSQEGTFEVATQVAKPERWNLEHPAMYRARVEVLSDGKLSDVDSTNFGIREFHFDPNTGFWLNGKNFKVKGVALHADVGALGMAAPLGAWEVRLAAMKKVGANAIRTAHNPVAPEFLDLCDRMGFLVMDEMFDQWTVAKNPYDYHLYFKEWYLRDTRDTVKRDRNHPSVILWSAGNEIHDTPNAELAKSILGPLVAEFHKNDPTRPVTQALFRPNVSHDYDNGLADMLDVIGQNYRPLEILAAHKQNPARKIIGTENIHDRDSWVQVRDHPEYSGMFLWSGVDYLGESRKWPVIASGSGMADRTNAIKQDGRERESWWVDAPIVHMGRRTAPPSVAPTDPGYELTQGTGSRAPQTVFADWTPRNTAPHDENLEIYSNCSQVELSLNGKSLGSKPLNADAGPRQWIVAYQPGVLKATCLDHKRELASETFKTAGPASRIVVTVERAKLSQSFDDIAYVRATVQDADGTVVPDSVAGLNFSVTGPGVILATDNADNSDHSGFQRPDRAACRGTAIAIVRATAATGNVVLSVASDGLKGSTLTLPITR